MRKLLPVLLVACAGGAWAQNGEVWFNAGESILSNSGIGSNSATGTKDDFKLDNGFRFGFRFGFNSLGYATKEGSRIRPFGTAGIHFSNFVPPGSSVTSGGGSTKFGVNYGGGVKVKLTSLWAVRFDVRRYETRKPFDLLLKDGWLHQTEVSAGVGMVF